MIVWFTLILFACCFNWCLLCGGVVYDLCTLLCVYWCTFGVFAGCLVGCHFCVLDLSVLVGSVSLLVLVFVFIRCLMFGFVLMTWVSFVLGLRSVLASVVLVCCLWLLF